MAINTKKGVEELISYTVVTDKKALVNLLKKSGVQLNGSPSDLEVTTAVLVANKKSESFKNELAKLLQGKLPQAGETFCGIVGNSQDFGFTGVDDFTYEMGFTGIEGFDDFTGVDDFNGFTGWDDFQSMSGSLIPTFTENLKKSIDSAQKTTAKTTPSKADLRKMSAAERKASGQKTKAGSAIAGIWSFVNKNVLTPDNINAGISAGLGKVNADTAARQNAIDEKALALLDEQRKIADDLNKKKGVSTNTILYVTVGLIAVVGIGFLIYKSTKDK
ncbi:MAG: hypothetical protein ACOVNU_09160 [Candidatus Kapaibacteriota bacterium]